MNGHDLVDSCSLAVLATARGHHDLARHHMAAIVAGGAAFSASVGWVGVLGSFLDDSGLGPGHSYQVSTPDSDTPDSGALELGAFIAAVLNTDMEGAVMLWKSLAPEAAVGLMWSLVRLAAWTVKT